jgi:hypothetical protein
MRKVFISKTGKVSFIEGPNTYSVSVNITDDPFVESHDVTNIDSNLWNKWKEEKVSAKQIKKEIKSSQNKL